MLLPYAALSPVESLHTPGLGLTHGLLEVSPASMQEFAFHLISFHITGHVRLTSCAAFIQRITGLPVAPRLLDGLLPILLETSMK